MKTYDEREKDITLKMKRMRQRRTGTGLVCLALAAVLVAVLFVPYDTSAPDVSRYASSPYYGIIQRINEATYTKPAYRNNFESLTASLSNAADAPTDFGDIHFDASDDMPMAGAAPESSENASYVEITDNQVAGVTESDIIKRSTEYIYYLRDGELAVYSIAGENSSQVGIYAVTMASDVLEYFSDAEMYLSEDCATVTLVLDGFHKQYGSCAILVNLDVTDPGSIRETGRVYVTGSYASSRVVDGTILLMSKFRVRSDKDFDDESTYLPQVGTPGNMTSVAAEDIIAPDTLSNTYYTVVCTFDEKSLDVTGSAAFLSYSDSIYVSTDHIFATRSFSESTENGGSRTMTEVSCLAYSGGGLEYRGSVILEGSVKDQYSMDEYNGTLRVVTSISNTVVTIDGEMANAAWERSASLYCVSLDNFEITASVEKFAPEGERAESVRFDGPNCYVCTAEVITLTDPVYFFDLSDPGHITWTDTGTIDGYSTSLIQLGDGYLLGIGFGAERNLKVEVYEEADGSVVSVCAYEQWAGFSQEYKSYLVDRENDLIGLAVRSWENGSCDYVLLHFDGYDLNELIRVPISDLSDVRGVLIDGWLYVLSADFAVEKVW